jgi:hypothetical protein
MEKLMSTTESTDNLANFFVSSAEALKAKPILEARVAELEATIEALKLGSKSKDEAIDDYIAKVKAQDDHLKEVEQRLDDASFRELQARDHLESLLRVINGATATAKEAGEFLNPPQPEPEPEAMPQAESAQVYNGPMGDAFVAGSQEPEAQSSSPFAGSTGESVPIDPSQEASQASQEPTRPTSLYLERVETPSVGQGASPFVQSAAAQSAPATPHGEMSLVDTHPASPSVAASPSSSQESMAIPTASRPHAGQPSWAKPNSMSWSEWIAKGGQKASWM